MPKWSLDINHLSYADDTILFCSGERNSVIKMMYVLRKYEEISGHLINKSKSFFYLHEKTHLIYTIKLRKLTCIRQGNFPFIYLGCPVYYGRKRGIHFEDIIRKLSRRVLPWQNRFLSHGGKIILIKHILQFMPIHLLSAMTPPKGVIKAMHQVFAKFFWGSLSAEKKETLGCLGRYVFAYK